VADLLADPGRLDTIAAAGQRRTLKEHTYQHRVMQLSELLDARLGARAER
jgi:spore maturation protein CgeB